MNDPAAKKSLSMVPDASSPLSGRRYDLVKVDTGHSRPASQSAENLDLVITGRGHSDRAAESIIALWFDRVGGRLSEAAYGTTLEKVLSPHPQHVRVEIWLKVVEQADNPRLIGEVFNSAYSQMAPEHLAILLEGLDARFRRAIQGGRPHIAEALAREFLRSDLMLSTHRSTLKLLRTIASGSRNLGLKGEALRRLVSAPSAAANEEALVLLQEVTCGVNPDHHCARSLIRLMGERLLMAQGSRFAFTKALRRVARLHAGNEIGQDAADALLAKRARPSFATQIYLWFCGY